MSDPDDGSHVKDVSIVVGKPLETAFIDQIADDQPVSIIRPQCFDLRVNGAAAAIVVSMDLKPFRQEAARQMIYDKPEPAGDQSLAHSAKPRPTHSTRQPRARNRRR